MKKGYDPVLVQATFQCHSPIPNGSGGWKRTSGAMEVIGSVSLTRKPPSKRNAVERSPCQSSSTYPAAPNLPFQMNCGFLSAVVVR